MAKKENKKLLNEKDTHKVSGGSSLTEEDKSQLKKIVSKVDLKNYDDISAILGEIGINLSPQKIKSLLNNKK